jgi:sporulation protein YlmC with PRC-barrel domain
MTMAGRVLHAQLHLLDRQLVDQRTGRLLGKVDDVELDLDAEVPVVAALITGRVRIPAYRITDVTSAVEISSADLDLDRHDDWVEQHIIGHIPGAGDATE